MAGKVKWLVLGLAVSLAFNVFIAGLIIGRGVKPPPPRQSQPIIGFNIRKLNKYLSPAERRHYGNIVAEQRELLRQKFWEMKKIERQIEQLIIAEEVDAEALFAALEAREQFSQELQQPMRRIVAEAILGMDRESRVEFAKDVFGPRQRPRRAGPGDRRPEQPRR